MRHKKTFNHLGRNSAHRNAMLSNMASSLIMHKRIETTTAKAKELRRYIEPLITRSKEDSTHSRRVVFGYLQDKEAVSELFREVGTRVADRPGGYTRIIKLGHRQGDNADMCLIELVDYNENLLSEKAAAKKAVGRRRRGAKKGTAAAPAAEASARAVTPEEVPAATEETPVTGETPVTEEATAEEVIAETEEATEEEVKAEAEEATAVAEEPAASEEAPASDDEQAEEEETKNKDA
jgi:large subunit ribosomal protein L17